MHTAPLLLHALPLYLDEPNPVENPFGWLADVSLTLANILCSAIVSAFQPQPSEVGSLVGQSMALAPFLICGLLAYVGLLVLLSRLALILVTIAAPLGIPVALYRGEGRLTAMWGRMLMSSLAVPVVAAVGLAASIGVGVALQRATWWFVVP